LVKFIKFLFFIVFVSTTTVILFFLYNIRPSDGIRISGGEVQVVPGESVRSLGIRLESEGYIRSALLFEVIVRALKYDKKLRAGWYKFEANRSTIRLIDDIFNGKMLTVSFTVPEGATLKQVRDILVRDLIVDEKQLDNFLMNSSYCSLIGLPGYRSAEGFLFPETYRVNKGATPREVLSAMVSRFFFEVGKIYPAYNDLSRDDLYSKLILASIIEKEVRVHEEASVVSGVFYNRLKTGMYLQSCATVQYVLDKPKERLLFEDLEIIHPYNTYNNRGLPPGPVSNPGRIALRASFYPERHSYLFFVVKDPARGTHHFSGTYSEHIKAQDRYKAIKGFGD